MTLEELLTINVPDFWQRVHRDSVQDTVGAFHSWYLSGRKPEGFDQERWQLQQLCRFLTHQISQTSEQVRDLHNRYAQFASHVQRSATAQEQWQHQEGFLRFLGYSNRDIQRDRAATKRWFGNDAIKDRYQNRAAAHEHTLCFLLERLGQLIQYHGQQYSDQDTETLLRALDLEEHITPLFRHEGDERVPIKAMSCLQVALDHLAAEIVNKLDPSLVQVVYRIASDPYRSVWLQSEALALLFSLDSDNVAPLLTHRFSRPAPVEDDFFFRGRALRVLFDLRGRRDLGDFAPLLQHVFSDSSPFVRQQLAQYLYILREPRRQSVFQQLAMEDESPQVRGRAWLGMPRLLREESSRENYRDCYLQRLGEERDPLVMRLMMELAPELLQNLGEAAGDFYTRCLEQLTAIHTSHDETRVRRWAAQARERLWYSRQRQLEAASLRSLSELGLARVVSLPRPDMEENELGRQLAAISNKGFGFDVETGKKRLRVRGGYRSGFRLWRFLHEWLNPATDKRQNHNHTVGRIYHGHMQAPPQLLAESSETKVPGEPLLLDAEQGWRPYLPLVDQVLSSLDQGWPTRPVKLYTSEGVTEMMPPRSLPARLWAKFHIMRDFKRLARLRNWQEDSDLSPASYLGSLQKFGFSFSINGHIENESALPVDDRVARFFPAVVPFYSLGDFWRELENYFYSVYQNTVQQLSLFLAAIAGLFLGQHFWLNIRFRAARRAIPFVIGGWGTRGKSGTERLKSALLNASGVSLISKSTGCEAQFLYAPAQRPLKEMFLFRPYDKASIWEQLHITRLAARLNVKVFLWECMGLTPRYIDILQQQWMRDDLSTITNCYPDHEDIQGPAGIDIPRVMTRFVPKNAILITSEDTMSPLLEAAARENSSDYHHVGWREGFLLTPDVLSRFPYEEHPTNIALVLKLADVLGFEADFALKSMADYVVPDLGVLKVYPECNIQRRRFVFINGMSANERFATLNNWTRLGLHEITPEENPDVWLTTVVNNRSDRIARSQVFARMLANDLSADMHFLIGSNLDGLQNYIEEAWQARVDELPLEAKTADERGKLLERFTQICGYLRLCTDEQQIQQRVQSMLQGLAVTEGEHVASYWQSGESFEAAIADLEESEQFTIKTWIAAAQNELAQYRQWRELLADSQQEIDADAFRKQLWQWYQQRFVVIEDVHASGNSVIQTMIQSTPPGLCNKMMGLQNIKGTGLDFIYRCQAWDRTWKLCQQLVNGTEKVAENAVKELSNINDFGLLDHELVRDSCARVRDSRIAQTELFQAELNVIEGNLERQLGQITETISVTGGTTLVDKLIEFVEAFMDPGSAVSRRKVSEKIYDDLAEQRISVERAVFELQRLNKEQKGGWLRQKIKWLPKSGA